MARSRWRICSMLCVKSRLNDRAFHDKSRWASMIGRMRGSLPLIQLVNMHRVGLEVIGQLAAGDIDVAILANDLYVSIRLAGKRERKIDWFCSAVGGQEHRSVVGHFQCRADRHSRGL